MQTEEPFQKWESTQEFQINGNNPTRVNHTINHEFHTTGKIVIFPSGSQAGDKIRQALSKPPNQ